MIGFAAQRWLPVLAGVLLAVADPGLAAGSAGTDELAVDLVRQLAPTYRPWVAPLPGVPGEGVEPWLFALQAALGLGVIGWYLAARHRRTRAGKGAGQGAA